MLVAASSLAVLPLLAFAVSLVALVRLGRGGDRNAPGTREGCNPRCQISGVRNPLAFTYDANLG